MLTPSASARVLTPSWIVWLVAFVVAVVRVSGVEYAHLRAPIPPTIVETGGSGQLILTGEVELVHPSLTASPSAEELGSTSVISSIFADTTVEPSEALAPNETMMEYPLTGDVTAQPTETVVPDDATRMEPTKEITTEPTFDAVSHTDIPETVFPSTVAPEDNTELPSDASYLTDAPSYGSLYPDETFPPSMFSSFTSSKEVTNATVKSSLDFDERGQDESTTESPPKLIEAESSSSIDGSEPRQFLEGTLAPTTADSGSTGEVVGATSGASHNRLDFGDPSRLFAMSTITFFASLFPAF